MIRRLLPCIALVLACSRNSEADVSSNVTPETATSARVATLEGPVTPGDCAEALRRAAAAPGLPVDHVPSPVRARPAPLQNVPRGALRKDGSADVKVDVLIDTLGRPDMNTFVVVSASHPWLVTNVKSVIAKWKFFPAELAGCRVPRIYHFMASAPARTTAAR